MYQQIINIYPVYKDSWTILSAETAEKHVDRSIFKYGQTGIPKEIKVFFYVENLKPGSREGITLLHNNKSYVGEISIDNTARTKLSWGKELNDVINTKLGYCSKYFIEDDRTTDEIVDRPYIKFTRVSDKAYKIELLIK